MSQSNVRASLYDVVTFPKVATWVCRSDVFVGVLAASKQRDDVVEVCCLAVYMFAAQVTNAVVTFVYGIVRDGISLRSEPSFGLLASALLARLLKIGGAIFPPRFDCRVAFQAVNAPRFDGLSLVASDLFENTFRVLSISFQSVSAYACRVLLSVLLALRVLVLFVRRMPRYVMSLHALATPIVKAVVVFGAFVEFGSLFLDATQSAGFHLHAPILLRCAQ